jgi:hypothetical protein
MRENRPSGSEGGEAQTNALSLPLWAGQAGDVWFGDNARAFYGVLDCAPRELIEGDTPPEISPRDKTHARRTMRGPVGGRADAPAATPPHAFPASRPDAIV